MTPTPFYLEIAMDPVLRRYRMTRQDAKRVMLKQLGYPPWPNCTIDQKATFIASYEFAPQRRKYVRRTNKRDKRVVKKQLIQQQRNMKRRGGMMGRKFRRKSILANTKLTLLMADITESDNPEHIVSSLLKNTSRQKIGRNEVAKLSKFFIRPMAITLHMGKAPFVVVKEEAGMYSFEASDDQVKKIKHNIKTLMRREGVKAKFQMFDLADDKKHMDLLSEILKG